MTVTKRDLFVLSALLAYATGGESIEVHEPMLEGLNGWFERADVEQLVIPWTHDGAVHSDDADEVRGEPVRPDEIEPLYALRDGLERGLKTSGASPWPGVVKAYLSGDAHARLALADLFEEAGDQPQAQALREPGIALYVARWADDQTLGQQMSDVLGHPPVGEQSLDTRRAVAARLIDTFPFHTVVEAQGCQVGLKAVGIMDHMAWSLSREDLIEDMLNEVTEELGEGEEV